MASVEFGVTVMVASGPGVTIIVAVRSGLSAGAILGRLRGSSGWLAFYVIFVAAVLSGLYWVIGLPYWILVGSFAGIVEIVPVIGPIVAGALAIGVGLTSSVTVAALAGGCLFGVRMLEDYLILPRVLGDAVGLSPIVVLVSVTSVGILFGGFAVVLAIPIAAVIVTLVDVIVRDKDPAEEDVPAVLFSGKDA